MGAMAAILCGALGGILPTIAKLGGTYVSAPGTPWPDPGLWFGVVCLGFVGGIIALAAGRAEVKQAIFAGIAAPGIITNVVAGAAESHNANKTTSLLSVVSVANAQETSPAQGAGSPVSGIKYITVSPKVNGGLPSLVDIPIAASTGTTGANEPDKSIQWHPIGSIKSLSGTSRFVVPKDTTSVQIGGTTIPLKGDQSDVTVDVSTQPKSDFLWALGAPRTYEVKSIIPKLGNQ